MKKTFSRLALACSICIVVFFLDSCSKREDYSWVKKGIDSAKAQLLLTADEIKDSKKLPRSIYSSYDVAMLSRQLEDDSLNFKGRLHKPHAAEKIGKVKLVNIYDWTSGFFPGSLWIVYELTKDEEASRQAKHYTNLLEPLRHYTGTHDLGFMVRCSFGEAMRLSPADSIKAIYLETADNLIGRFNPSIGCIRSWDFGSWNFPVIIDNMMNLDLLYDATALSGDSKYAEIAEIHANTTIKNHFREDMTSYHVVSYNNNGTVEIKQTHQGKNNDSVWARGQAWALYGYTRMYVNTQNMIYLDFACRIANMIMEKVKTKDAIPYWDYDAPVSEETPRDASAAAVTASALVELSSLLEDEAAKKKYFNYAEKILKSLSSEDYLAQVGTNAGFVLKHSTGSLPHGSEIDAPLSYADYYYLEALKRYMQVKRISYQNL